MGHTQAILLTGATGALGPSLAAELLASDPTAHLHVLIRPSASTSIGDRFRDWRRCVTQVLAENGQSPSHLEQRTTPVAGDVATEGLGLSSACDSELRQGVTTIIHAAADTQFLGCPASQYNINVNGTRRMLDFARGVQKLDRFIHVSTVCTSGMRTGSIDETFCEKPTGFVNNYEKTKWEAEQLALQSELPLGVARVSIVIGSHTSGAVYRPGALHQLMKWFSRGYVPAIPGTDQTRVDLVSTEVVARFLAQTLKTPWDRGTIWNVAAGTSAATLHELSAIGWAEMRPGETMHNREIPTQPFIVDQARFDALRMSKTSHRDRVLRQSMDSINSFLPMLLYPRVYETSAAEALWGGPLPWPDWRTTLVRMLRSCGFSALKGLAA
jgi:nucleoside-diphosphate-sugar epimerase